MFILLIFSSSLGHGFYSHQRWLVVARIKDARNTLLCQEGGTIKIHFCIRKGVRSNTLLGKEGGTLKDTSVSGRQNQKNQTRNLSFNITWAPKLFFALL